MRVRKARIFDTLKHIQWLMEQKWVDWDTLDYPTTEKYAVEEDGQVLALNHAHSAIVLESMAFSPEATAKDRLESSLALVENYIQRAQQVGAKELYYISSDERTDEAAAKHLGFEKVVCLRKKL